MKELTIVEKVAKAIYQKALDQRPLTPLGLDADWPTWDELADKDRNYALGEARAAIGAMMEPTQEQINHVLDLAANEKIGQSGWIEAYKEIYRAMIQAALKEGQ